LKQKSGFINSRKSEEEKLGGKARERKLAGGHIKGIGCGGDRGRGGGTKFFKREIAAVKEKARCGGKNKSVAGKGVRKAEREKEGGRGLVRTCKLG